MIGWLPSSRGYCFLTSRRVVDENNNVKDRAFDDYAIFSW